MTCCRSQEWIEVDPRRGVVRSIQTIPSTMTRFDFAGRVTRPLLVVVGSDLRPLLVRQRAPFHGKVDHN